MRGLAKKIRPLLALILLSLSGCIVSDLSNSFDPKSPAGLLLNLTGGSISSSGTNSGPSGPKTCVFDTSKFDSCTLGP
ncbi:hypothetical protein Lepil_2447 [Leptonema illini DSM 21528]|uniref:Lipoprotein n=1 Tax=Leptonema illini DSM 21528 TaxID=929563 RepID=H2CJG5_9LEPT|nr:hypothetical protein Lepil_2447 [Leptonema illini DSM 21528]